MEGGGRFVMFVVDSGIRRCYLGIPLSDVSILRRWLLLLDSSELKADIVFRS